MPGNFWAGVEPAGADLAAATSVLTGTSSTCESSLGVSAKVPASAGPLGRAAAATHLQDHDHGNEHNHATNGGYGSEYVALTALFGHPAGRGALWRPAGLSGAGRTWLASRPLGHSRGGGCAIRTRRDVAPTGALLSACHLRLSPHEDSRPSTSLTCRGPGRPWPRGKVSQLLARVQRSLRRRDLLARPIFEQGTAMVLAEAERVAGCHFRAAVCRPRRPALAQQRQSRGRLGSQCAWLAKPPPQPPSPGSSSGPAAIWSTTRGLGHGIGRVGSLSSGRLMTRADADADRIDRFDKADGTDRPRSSYLAPVGTAGAIPIVRNFIFL